MNYLVMECHPGYAVVLSGDGRFLKVANMRYEVGQRVDTVVEVQLLEVQEKPQKHSGRRWISTVAAMAACLVLAVTGLFWQNMPYASVYMAINPEVRIDVNRSDRVVAVEGMNFDGQQLLQGYEPERKELDLVMDELVDRAIDQGYLHEGGKIVLSFDAEETWIASHETAISDQLTNHLTGKMSVTIDVAGTDPQQPKKSTTTGQSVVIPMDGDSGYGDSAYGAPSEEGSNPSTADDSDYGYADSGYAEADSGYADDGQTDYGISSGGSTASDYGSSAYEAPESSGQSDYGASAYEADSGYDDSGYDD